MWFFWLVFGVMEMFGVVFFVGYSLWFLKFLFWGESGGYFLKIFFVIFWFFFIWLFWVCMIMDIGNFYYVIIVLLFLDWN